MKTIKETATIPDDFVDRFLESFLTERHFPKLVDAIQPPERLFQLCGMVPRRSRTSDPRKIVDETNIVVHGTYNCSGLPIMRLFTI